MLSLRGGQEEGIWREQNRICALLAEAMGDGDPAGSQAMRWKACRGTVAILSASWPSDDRRPWTTAGPICASPFSHPILSSAVPPARAPSSPARIGLATTQDAGQPDRGVREWPGLNPSDGFAGGAGLPPPSFAASQHHPRPLSVESSPGMPPVLRPKSLLPPHEILRPPWCCPSRCSRTHS